MGMLSLCCSPPALLAPCDCCVVPCLPRSHGAQDEADEAQDEADEDGEGDDEGGEGQGEAEREGVEAHDQKGAGLGPDDRGPAQHLGGGRGHPRQSGLHERPTCNLMQCVDTISALVVRSRRLAPLMPRLSLQYNRFMHICFLLASRDECIKVSRWLRVMYVFRLRELHVSMSRGGSEWCMFSRYLIASPIGRILKRQRKLM